MPLRDDQESTNGPLNERIEGAEEIEEGEHHSPDTQKQEEVEGASQVFFGKGKVPGEELDLLTVINDCEACKEDEDEVDKPHRNVVSSLQSICRSHILIIILLHELRIHLTVELDDNTNDDDDTGAGHQELK